MKKQFNDIIEEWKNEKSKYVKESTMAAYNLIIENHISMDFNNKFITNISNNYVQSIFDKKINKGLSEKTCRDILVVIKMIIDYSINKGYCCPILIKIKFPTKRTTNKVEVFSKTEESKIIKYINDNFSFGNLGILICLYSGIRIGEICALKWSDIDIDKKVICISKTLQRIYDKDKKTKIIIDSAKTANSIREIPIADKLLEIFKPFYNLLNKDYYVVTNALKYTEPRTYRNYYASLLDKIGVRKIKFHSLRHTFATRCIEANVDYKTLSVILGHSNISTTLNLYVHPNYEQKKKCIDEMSKLLD